MSNTNNGGRAFARPASEFTGNGTCPDGNDPIHEQEGLSARAYIAVRAMQITMLSLEQALAPPAAAATLAVQYADALIAELDKPLNPQTKGKL